MNSEYLNTSRIVEEKRKYRFKDHPCLAVLEGWKEAQLIIFFCFRYKKDALTQSIHAGM